MTRRARAEHADLVISNGFLGGPAGRDRIHVFHGTMVEHVAAGVTGSRRYRLRQALGGAVPEALCGRGATDGGGVELDRRRARAVLSPASRRGDPERRRHRACSPPAIAPRRGTGLGSNPTHGTRCSSAGSSTARAPTSSPRRAARPDSLCSSRAAARRRRRRALGMLSPGRAHLRLPGGGLRGVPDPLRGVQLRRARGARVRRTADHDSGGLDARLSPSMSELFELHRAARASRASPTRSQRVGAPASDRQLGAGAGPRVRRASQRSRRVRAPLARADRSEVAGDERRPGRLGEDLLTARATQLARSRSLASAAAAWLIASGDTRTLAAAGDRAGGGGGADAMAGAHDRLAADRLPGARSGAGIRRRPGRAACCSSAIRSTSRRSRASAC